MSENKFDLRKSSTREYIYLVVIVLLVTGGFVWSSKAHKPSHEEEMHASMTDKFTIVEEELKILVSTGDSSILEKVKNIRAQIDDAKENLAVHNGTLDEKKVLEHKLAALKYEYQHYQNTIVDNMLLFIDEKDTEIAALKAEVETFKNQLAASKNKRTSTSSKVEVAVITYEIVALTKKNEETSKARQTQGLKMNLQLHNSSQEFNPMTMEVIDPRGMVIPSTKDEIKLSSTPITFYFKPSTKYVFKSGKYTVKLMDPTTNFEVSQAITLF